jgi:membrane-associated phospholipid phosphatase
MNNNFELKIIKDLQKIINNNNIILKIFIFLLYIFNIYSFITIIIILYYNNIINFNNILLIIYSQFIIYILKNIIKRKHPYYYKNIIKITSEMDIVDKYSFPSSYTINAFLLSNIIFKNTNINYDYISLLIGLTQIYSGSNYPSDILLSIIISKILFNIFYI